METIPVVRTRYRMGAEELIELGRPVPFGRPIHQPFLAGRAEHESAVSQPFMGQVRRRMGDRAQMGDILDIAKDVGGVITGALGFVLSTLGDLVSVPLNILSQGIDIAFTNIASLLDHIPIIGGLLAQILLLGNTVVKFALSVPGMLLHGLGNIMSGISKALLAKNTPAQNQKEVDKAKGDIVGKAPPGLADAVKKALDSSGVSGSNLTPSLQTPTTGLPGSVPTPSPQGAGTDLTGLLAVGLPVVGVTAAALLFAR